ncbi:TPA: hypothetical protein ACGO97_002220 [Streptococcus suis]
MNLKTKEVIKAIFNAYGFDYEEIDVFFRVPNYCGLNASSLEEFEENLRTYAEDIAIFEEEDRSSTLVVYASNGDVEVNAPLWEEWAEPDSGTSKM